MRDVTTRTLSRQAQAERLFRLLEKFGVVQHVETYTDSVGRRHWKFKTIGGVEHDLYTPHAELFVQGALAARTALQIRHARAMSEALTGNSTDAEHEVLIELADDLGVAYTPYEDLLDLMGAS